MTDSKRASWVALYANSLREATHILPDKEFKLLLHLTSFINAQGNCFPTIKDIAAAISLQIEEVNPLLESLEARGYISFLRRNQRDQYTGQFVPNVYGLALNFVALSPDNEVVARQLRDALPPIRNLGSTSESYTTKELHLKEPTVNNNQELPPQVPPNGFASESETAAGWPQTIEQSRLDGEEGKDKEQETGGHQREAQPARNAQGSSTPPRSAPPPSAARRPQAEYGEPFAQEDKESLAQRVKEQCKTRIKQARWLIDPYPLDVVKAGLYQLAKEKDVETPYGLLKYWLDKNQIDPNVDGDPYEGFDKH